MRPPSRSVPRRAQRYFYFGNAGSSQFQRRQSEECENGGQNPKPNNDGVLLPADQLEMVMKGRHRENAAPGQLKTQHLHDDRDRFEDKNTADDSEEKFLFTTNGDDTDHSTDSERAGVPHENFGRVTIKPEETKAGTDERGTNHRQLTGEWIKRDLQIFRDLEITGGIRKKSVGEGDCDGATDGETVETVGQIDRIGGTDDYNCKKDEREPPHIGDHGSFEERQIKRARLDLEQRVGEKNHGDHGRQHQLRSQFHPARHAVGFFLGDLEIVVEESEDTQIEHTEKYEPDEAIIGTGPEHAGKEDRADYQHATHGGGALFSTVQFGQTSHFLDAADGLADLERDQFSDDEIPKNQRQSERGHGCRDRAKGHVKEDVETADLIAQAMEIEHHRGFPPAG